MEREERVRKKEEKQKGGRVRSFNQREEGERGGRRREKTYLLLESSRDEPSQLHQTCIDPVTSPLLNDLQKKGFFKHQ